MSSDETTHCPPRKHWNYLDLLLGAIFVAGVFLALKSSNDGLPAWLRGTRLARLLSQYDTGNQNVHDTAAGIIVSLVIYLLVVRLPERDKRTRVRRNLQLQYDAFKAACIRIFLSASGRSFDTPIVEALKDREQFKLFFKERHSASQTRWHAVANGLDEQSIRAIVIEFEIFIAEVRFTLMAVDVENPEVFAFLKDLANGLYRARNCSADYEDVKSLLNVMWSVFTGWSWVEGYVEKDVIADMIRAT